MSLCNLPSFSFSLSFPIRIPSLPSITIPTFTLAFTLVCNLD